MKITIHTPINPACGYEITTEEKAIRNMNSNMFPRQFDESDLLTILGEKGFEKFEDGKFIFDVPVWKIKAIEGILNATKNFQLRFIEEYTN